MLMCPVALLADAATWLFRADLLLTIRLTSAVALAATAFCLAILVAEQAEPMRGLIAAGNGNLSEVIAQPLLADANGAPGRVAPGQ